MGNHCFFQDTSGETMMTPLMMQRTNKNTSQMKTKKIKAFPIGYLPDSENDVFGGDGRWCLFLTSLRVQACKTISLVLIFTKC